MAAQVHIVVCGDARVGKSAFIHRMATGEFLGDYKPSVTATATSVDDPACVFHEIPGGEDVFSCADWPDHVAGAIIITDLTSRITGINGKHFMRELTRRYGNVPVLALHNHADAAKAPTLERCTPVRGATNHVYSVKGNLGFDYMFSWVQALIGPH